MEKEQPSAKRMLSVKVLVEVYPRKGYWEASSPSCKLVVHEESPDKAFQMYEKKLLEANGEYSSRNVHKYIPRHGDVGHKPEPDDDSDYTSNELLPVDNGNLVTVEVPLTEEEKKPEGEVVDFFDEPKEEIGLGSINIPAIEIVPQNYSDLKVSEMRRLLIQRREKVDGLTKEQMITRLASYLPAVESAGA